LSRARGYVGCSSEW